jgi:hypothetical protein
MLSLLITEVMNKFYLKSFVITSTITIITITIIIIIIIIRCMHCMYLLMYDDDDPLFWCS